MIHPVIADSRHIPLVDESVHCVITSPPFYRQRHYADEKPLIWEDGKSAVLGWEESPDEFVAHLVQIMREVKRVLRHDGAAFVELGLYTRDYCDWGIPARFHLALLEDGWLVRSVIIWVKGVSLSRIPSVEAIIRKWGAERHLDVDGLVEMVEKEIWDSSFIGNATPESFKWRPTQSWTPIFLLTKGKRAWVDTRGALEPHRESSLKRYEYGLNVRAPDDGLTKSAAKGGIFHSERTGDFVDPAGRNLRSVWAYPPIFAPVGGYTAGGHYATWTPKLVRTMLAIGCPQLICSRCKAGWIRKTKTDDGRRLSVPEMPWVSQCSCKAPPTRGAVVLDPFAGSGATGLAASKMGHTAVCLDISPTYARDNMMERASFVQLEMSYD
jgi:hypothetical protein